MYKKRSKESKLSIVEEQEIFMLWILEGSEYGRDVEKYVPQYFSGGAVALLMGGSWSTGRTRHIKNLIKLGWVEQQRIGRNRYYRLTDGGYLWVKAKISDARNNRTSGAYSYHVGLGSVVGNG